MRTRIFLSPSQPQLVGKYSQSADSVDVICSATQAFTFAMPALGSSENIEFVVYNLPTSTYNVTVTGAMWDGTTSRVLEPGDTATFVDSLTGMWLFGDGNRVGVYGT